MEYEKFINEAKELALEFAKAIEKQRKLGVVMAALYVTQTSLAQKFETQKKGVGYDMLIDLSHGLLEKAKAIKDGNY